MRFKVFSEPVGHIFAASVAFINNTETIALQKVRAESQAGQGGR